MKLHLGVVDIPYVEPPPQAKPGGKARASRRSEPQTTGSIAEILESRYGVMSHFVELHGAEIAEDLEAGLAGALETLLMGGSPATSLYSSGEGKIEERFRRFLEARELDALGIPGVPTRVSLEGVNHRLKIRRGPVRPSFIDTGQYQATHKAWVEE